MIVKPGTFRLKRSLNNQVARIFANGLDGFWYDPLLPYLYDTSTGVAQVDAAEDPIGLLIDRSKGAGLGAEATTNGLFNTDTGWTKSGSVTYANGQYTVSDVGGADALISQQLTGIPSGVLAKVAVTLTENNTTATGLRLRQGSSAGSSAYGDTLNLGGAVGAVGTFVFYIVAGQNNPWITLHVSTINTYVVVTEISVKPLAGNHATQATAAARPTYRVDAAGRPYAALLGTDDNMTSATGGGGTTGFYLCAAIVPAGGAGTAREIYSDSGTNTGIHVELDASNKLSMSAGNGAAFTTLASTATVDVSTPYVLEAYIDAGVMYVQINGATVESVAAPTITAGTAGFTIGKDNLLASDFMIGNLYHLLYVKNSALTAAQRVSERKYASSKIGLAL